MFQKKKKSRRNIDIKIEKESEVAQSCLTLCDPMDCSLSGFSVHGIFQARVLEWGAIAFSRGSFQPRDWTWSPTLQAEALPSEPPGKPIGINLCFLFSSYVYRLRIYLNNFYQKKKKKTEQSWACCMMRVPGQFLKSLLTSGIFNAEERHKQPPSLSWVSAALSRRKNYLGLSCRSNTMSFVVKFLELWEVKAYSDGRIWLLLKYKLPLVTLELSWFFQALLGLLVSCSGFGFGSAAVNMYKVNSFPYPS